MTPRIVGLASVALGLLLSFASLAPASLASGPFAARVEGGVIGALHR